VGLEVPHAHIHLIPINSVGDINFSNPKLKLTAEQLSEIAIKINKNFTYFEKSENRKENTIDLLA
ncbi:MAG: hypothetical protein N2053_12070, partial [Chitinispirillaceae bacterium]|nr:hypothetical protein [Chitinispirillaceae bacterium]